MPITVKKDAPATKANIDQLQVELTSLITQHVNATKPWTFYEEIEQFLGPWGPSGYPIGYGKYYCVLFTSNEKLQNDPETRAWVTNTMVKLQELLRDAILDKFKQGTLAAITEPELRKIAFDTHPIAYASGGLAKVVVAAPELLPTIALIPYVQYIPVYGNSIATFKQIIITIGAISGQVVGIVLVTLAGPAHSGVLRKAVDESGPNAILAEQRKNASYQAQFDRLTSLIRSGRLDRILWLEEVTDQLKTTAFPDGYWLDVARRTVQEADARKKVIAGKYRDMLQVRPETRREIDKNDPNWAKY
jgi:hypothetical protein